MHVVGQAEMAGNRPSLLRLDRVELGPTRAAASSGSRPPRQPIRARLSGAVLDLSPQFGTKPAAPATTASGTPAAKEAGPTRLDRRYPLRPGVAGA